MSDEKPGVIWRDECPVCHLGEADPPNDCDHCETQGGKLVPRRYVATDSLLSPAVNKAAGKALAKQLAGSHESGSFADVYEEAAIVLHAAIDALGEAS